MVVYVKIEKDREGPRFLTRNEINEIVDFILPSENVKTSLHKIDDIEKLIYKQFRDTLKWQFRGKKFCPDGINTIAPLIKEQFERSLLIEGFPTGPNTVDGFMASVMQLTLNTFHKSGMNTDTGFEALSALLYLKEIRKRNQIFVHFKKRLNRDQIFDLRRDMVHVKFSDLIEKTEIDNFESIYGTKNIDDLDDYNWLSICSKLAGREVDVNYPIIRIYLNVKKIIFNKILPETLVKKIINQIYVNTKDVDNTDKIWFAYSSISEGILEIHPIVENVVSDIENEEKNNFIKNMGVRHFLENEILGTVLDLEISGIESIEALYPKDVPIVSGLIQSYLLNDTLYTFDDEFINSVTKAVGKKNLKTTNVWYIEKSVDFFRFKGVKMEEVVELITHPINSIKIILEHENYFILTTPPQAKNLSPSDWIIRNISNTPKEDDSDEIKENYKEMVDISIHWFAVLEGLHLKKVLQHPSVDRTRTYSNNFHIMSSVFGIEICRSYHLYNLMEVMQTTGHLYPAYISFFSDFSTCHGFPDGIKLIGNSQQKCGVMSLCTIQEPGNVLNNAAINDRGGESILTPSSAIILGQQAGIGTGAKGGSDILNLHLDYSKINEKYLDLNFSELDSVLDKYTTDRTINSGVNSNTVLPNPSRKVTLDKTQNVNNNDRIINTTSLTVKDIYQLKIKVIGSGLPKILSFIEEISNEFDDFVNLDTIIKFTHPSKTVDFSNLISKLKK